MIEYEKIIMFLELNDINLLSYQKEFLKHVLKNFYKYTDKKKYKSCKKFS